MSQERSDYLLSGGWDGTSLESGMLLYHYTSPLHVKGCIYNGITLGQIPMLQLGTMRLIRGYQWLTKSRNFDQTWNRGSTLPYDRTAFRLTVGIEKPYNLIRWLDFCKKFKNDMEKDLNQFGDPENWFLYHGHIPAQWIIKVDGKNKKALLAVMGGES